MTPGGTVKKASGSYFSLLKPDEIRNVIRHLSARPASPQWISNVAPIDAYNVVRGGTALAEPLRKELALSGLRSESRPGFRPPAVGLLCETDTPFGKLLYEMLLKVIGPDLQQMSIDFSIADFRYADPFVEQCSNLKSLQITADCDLPLLLRACAGKLHTLDLNGYSMTKKNADAIAQNCTGLRTCKLVYQKTKCSFDDIWATIGPTVQELAYRVPFFTDEDGEPLRAETSWLEGIAKFCTKITTLEIGGTRRFSKKLLHLCDALGEKLKILRFMDFGDTPGPTDLADIRDACAKVRFDAHLSWDEVATLTTLGDRCVAIHAENRMFDGLEEATAALKNVEYAHIKVIEYTVTKFVDLFFSTPFIHLRTLWIESNQYQHELDMLDVIADHVKTVEDFRFSIHATYQGSYSKFAAENQGIKKVHIENRMDGLPITNIGLRLNAEFEALGVAKDFAQCSKLELLTVHNRFLSQNSDRIAEACVAMGLKDVDLFIGGTQYRTTSQR